MIRKRNLIILLFCLLLLPTQAFAETFNFGYYGTTSETQPIYADKTNMDDNWLDLTVDGAGSGEIVWLGTGEVELGRSTTPGTRNAPSGAKALKLISKDGKEVYAIIGHTSNLNGDTVVFQKGSTSSDGSSGGSGSDCDVCEMFTCPGWSQYMQGLEDIKNAIPPAPNWQLVANTFRDTIAPRIKADLEDLFGYAPDAPSAPSAPGVPDLPSDLDDRGMTEPTGKEDPGLGGSTFTPDDIKNGATVIQEREDPTGGFTILDPVSGLPSQEDFMKNLPNEGTATLPGSPSEGENTAPMPGDTTDQAPMPSDDTGTAPIPGDDGGTAPLPNESGDAPIPGDYNYPLPIPGN